MKNKHKTLNDGQKIVLGGPEERETRKAFRKVTKAFGKVVFVLNHKKRVQAMISTRTKAEAKTKKRKGKEGAYPQSGLSASKTPSVEGHGHSWESDDWSSSLADDSSTLATG